MTKPVSRREFMNLLGATFGTSALIRVGSALGMLPAVAALTRPVLAAPAPGAGKAVILGAGISGLTVAWELAKAGYEVTVLESSNRAGGRIMTVRSGDVVDEIGNRQVCEWDNEPHMYFNAGAARIPSTHRNLLSYCKELGVDLEVFINESKTALIQDDAMLDGKPIRNADVSTNVRGFLGELFAKSFSAAQLEQPFTESEAETILGLIRGFGSLNRDMKYTGSNRNGYASGGFIDHGVQKDIIEFKHLMKSRLIANTLSANEGETGPILMQPVGGMDRITAGFTRALGDRVKYQTPVMSVMVKEAGVEVVYLQDGAPQTITADYCFNCIPAHFMAGIEHNFPADYMQAMKYIRRGEAIKGAFQAKERFWEKEEIYGGISWTNAPIRQLWYPSHGIHKEKGVILAAYDFGNGGAYTRMTQAERVEWLLQGGEKLHPNYRQLVEKPITIAWHRMNHMLGCSARWGRSGGGMTMEEEALYHTLQAPALGRHYMIGDQISFHGAWQESAILSAHWALADMDKRVRSAA